jgi:hypothetical protein
MELKDSPLHESPSESNSWNLHNIKYLEQALLDPEIWQQRVLPKNQQRQQLLQSPHTRSHLLITQNNYELHYTCNTHSRVLNGLDQPYSIEYNVVSRDIEEEVFLSVQFCTLDLMTLKLHIPCISKESVMLCTHPIVKLLPICPPKAVSLDRVECRCNFNSCSASRTPSGIKPEC